MITRGARTNLIRIAAVVAVGAWPALSAGPASAYFERVEIGARGLALAGAYGSMVDDVSAAYWNPGALSLLPDPQGLFTYSRPYVVNGLSAGSVVAGMPLASGGAALSWNRTGVDNVISENLIGLSYGRWVYRDDDRTIAVGGTALFASVAFDPGAGIRDFGSKSKVTGDLGLLWQERGRVRMGAVLRHLGRPEFNFVGSGGGTRMPGGLELSASYRWRPESTIMFSRSDVGDHPTYDYAGEIWFYNVFAVRAGVFDEEFSGGFGIKGGRWEVDTAFLTHKDLGNTYRASFQYTLSREKGR